VYGLREELRQLSRGGEHKIHQIKKTLAQQTTNQKKTEKECSRLWIFVGKGKLEGKQILNAGKGRPSLDLGSRLLGSVKGGGGRKSDEENKHRKPSKFTENSSPDKKNKSSPWGQKISCSPFWIRAGLLKTVQKKKSCEDHLRNHP